MFELYQGLIEVARWLQTELGKLRDVPLDEVLDHVPPEGFLVGRRLDLGEVVQDRTHHSEQKSVATPEPFIHPVLDQL